MSDTSLYIPPSPQTIAERPLSKGVLRNLPPQGMETGSFLRLREFLTLPEGIRRTGSISHWGQGWTVDYPPVTGFWKLWRTSGTAYSVVSDRKFIYTMGQDGLTGVYDTYSTGTCSVSGSAVTGAGGANWSSDINVGDVIVLDADGDGDGPEEGIIKTVGGATSLTLTAALSGTYGAGTDYEIRKAFRTLCAQDRADSGTSSVSSKRRIQAIAADDYLIFVDGTRYPRAFNGTTFTQFGELTIIPQCLAYFRDRVHYGNIVSGDTYSRYQIQWSDVGSGSLATIGDSSYQSLPYQQGALRTLVPMGGNLVAFFDDAIYIGTPTNSPAIPVDYDRVDSGNIGIAGPRAYTCALDGIFFVGLTNIYYLSNQGFEAIGDPIAREVVEKCAMPQYISVESDPWNERIIFGFPKNGEEIESLWSFHWRSKAWSEEKVSCSTLGHFAIEYAYTIDGLDDLKQSDDSTPITIDTLTDRFGSIDEMSSIEGETGLFIGRYGSGYVDMLHVTGNEPLGEFITRDFDLGAADMKKTFTKFGLKIDRNLADDLTFTVRISGDRGITWKQVQSLTIPAGDSEGKTTFRYTGSLARFWVLQSSPTEPYVIEEFTYRVRKRGRENTYV
jgi:hypothetical protein